MLINKPNQTTKKKKKKEKEKERGLKHLYPFWLVERRGGPTCRGFAESCTNLRERIYEPATLLDKYIISKLQRGKCVRMRNSLIAYLMISLSKIYK